MSMEPAKRQKTEDNKENFWANHRKLARAAEKALTEKGTPSKLKVGEMIEEVNQQREAGKAVKNGLGGWGRARRALHGKVFAEGTRAENCGVAGRAAHHSRLTELTPSKLGSFSTRSATICLWCGS